MQSSDLLPTIVYFYMLIQLLAVSIVDVRTKRIHNMWAVLNIISYFILCFVYPEIYHLSIYSFFYSFVFLFVGFVLFLLRIMGGGDSKYLFSFFLMVPISIQFPVMSYIVMSTIAIGSTVFFVNLIRNFDKIKESIKVKDAQALKHCFGTKFSFAPVIFVSWIYLGWDLKILSL